MSNIVITENPERCSFCGQKKISVYNSSLSVWKCLSCGLLFRNILHSEDKFTALYKNAWLDSSSHKSETGGTDLKLARIYLQRLISYLGLKNLSGLKILDFGAGRGSMLTALSELGADAYGIEPFGYEYLKERGFKVFRNTEEIPEEISFDGIIAIDVIEHLFYPWDTINNLKELLSAKGWFYIATPNVDSLNAKLHMSNWRELYNPSHTYFFTPRCVETIFAKLGIVQFKRLYWFIKYGDNPLRKLVHFLLQYFQLDGEIRYVLHKTGVQKEKSLNGAGKVGVVLINCNGGKFTIPCIQSLQSGIMKPHKIIVIDNASKDGSDNEISAHFPDIQLIRSKVNVGFAAGNNIGIQELIKQGYKYIWVLNNDTELNSDCLKIQYDFLETNPHIAGCCGKILYSDSRKTIWYAGTELNKFVLRIRSRGMLKIDEGQYDLPQKTLFITGCSMFVRSDTWRQVGDFYENFFIYYEDFDWCLRAERQGFDFWYFPKAVIYHKVSGTMGKTNEKQTPLVTPPKVTYLMQRNQMFVLRRWKSGIGFFFILFTLETPRLLYYSTKLLYMNRFENLFALCKGMRDGLMDPFTKP